MYHTRQLSVIGLGYVGLPIAVTFARSGFLVIGFDINEQRIEQLRQGIDVTNEIDSTFLKAPNLHFVSHSDELNRADFHIITVPTPIDRANQPRLDMLCHATKIVAGILKRNDIVVFESTVYPGVTEQICLPILESGSCLRVSKDFGIGYSPERINPGDPHHRFDMITKVVASNDPKTLEVIADVYQSVMKTEIFRARSIQIAEAAKIIENTQRDLNIALMNELCRIFRRLDIDTHDVLTTAATKWNFHHFKPGLVGGHCIGVDPYYLSHLAEKVGYIPQLILAGRQMNNSMGFFIAYETLKLLLRSTRPLEWPLRVTILGITFKENIPDIRNSRVPDIVNELQDMCCQVQVHDPLADPVETMNTLGISLCSLESLRPAHGVVLAVAHDVYKHGGWSLANQLLEDQGGVVVDVTALLDRDSKPQQVTLWRP